MKTKIKELIRKNELEIARLESEMSTCSKLGYCNQERAFAIRCAHLRDFNGKLNHLLE